MRNLVHPARRRVQVFTQGRAHQIVERSLAFCGKVSRHGFKERGYFYCKVCHISVSCSSCIPSVGSEAVELVPTASPCRLRASQATAATGASCVLYSGL